MPILVLEGDKCGYIDTSGQFVITPQFTSAAVFNRHTGLAPAGEGGKMGFIDKTGHFVVTPQFNSAASRDWVGQHAI